MSRDDLARKIGKKYSYIAELERPEGMKSSTKLHAIASALSVTVSWLETGKGEKYLQAATQSQSHPARLTGEMILSAYRAAKKAISLTGTESDDFSPETELEDAHILARAILQQMTEAASGGTEHVQPEVGHGATARRSHRQDGGAGSAEGAQEAGGKSKPAARKSRKHAA